jgi:hypothetical protein
MCVVWKRGWKFIMQKVQARDKGGEEKISYAKVSGA